MGRVAGKVAIVTGAASGMGRADARLLAAEGASVVVTDLNETDGRAVAEEIGNKAIFLRLNVADEDNWKSVIAATVEKFGKLDILVNNAGIIALGTIVDTTLESWRLVNSVNSDGVFLGCKHAIPAMAKSGGGSIINMSSVAAIHGQSFVAAYTASKGAVRALTKNIAMYCKEQKNRIRCNSIHPDGVKTPMVAKVATGKDVVTQEDMDEIAKFGGMCEPEDVANLVLFLASDESRFVNGAEMLIDNAATITPPVGILARQQEYIVEKLLYSVWKALSLTGDQFRDELLRQLAPQLTALKWVHGLRICVADSAVSAARKRRIESQPPVPDAMLSLWVDFAGAAAHWEPLIDARVMRKTAYLVAEAEPLVNQQRHPSKPGDRVYGMCHVVFMSGPADMPRNEWLAVWKDSHTQIAIDTQSTFGYRQNLVVRRLSEATLPCDAIVEENFPPEAMTSDHAFYATGGDDALLQQHMNAMMESCARFIDFTKIDVIPMSEYLIKPLVRP